MEVKISPRKASDRVGIACMPLKKNVLNGRTDWECVKCNSCGRECWKMPTVDIVLNQGGKALCTECALREGMQK